MIAFPETSIEREIFVKGSRYGKLCFVARVSGPVRLDDSGYFPLLKEPDWEKASYYISIKGKIYPLYRTN